MTGLSCLRAAGFDPAFMDLFGLHPDRLLALWEPRHEPSRQSLEDHEDEQEFERLVDRVGQQALLEDRLGEIGAGLLECGYQDIRAGPGDATERDGRDRRRDQS